MASLLARGPGAASTSDRAPVRFVGYPGRVIDINDLRADPETYRASQTARGADAGLVDRILEADSRRRGAITDFESLRAE